MKTTKSASLMRLICVILKQGLGKKNINYTQQRQIKHLSVHLMIKGINYKNFFSISIMYLGGYQRIQKENLSITALVIKNLELIQNKQTKMCITIIQLFLCHPEKGKETITSHGLTKLEEVFPPANNIEILPLIQHPWLGIKQVESICLP